MTDRIIMYRFKHRFFYFSPRGLFRYSLLYFSHKKESTMLGHCDNIRAKAAQGSAVQRKPLIGTKHHGMTRSPAEESVQHPGSHWLTHPCRGPCQAALRPWRSACTSDGKAPLRWQEEHPKKLASNGLMCQWHSEAAPLCCPFLFLFKVCVCNVGKEF